MEKLIEKRTQIESDSVNRTVGFYKYTKSAQKKLDEISWAITYLIANRRIK
jgi:hypothetical protein